MQTLLVLAVIFMANGDPYIMDGMHPLAMSSPEICETRQAFLENYLRSVPDLPTVEGVYCITQQELAERITALRASTPL
jgi:hypothetical protein